MNQRRKRWYNGAAEKILIPLIQGRVSDSMTKGFILLLTHCKWTSIHNFAFRIKSYNYTNIFAKTVLRGWISVRDNFESEKSVQVTLTIKLPSSSEQCQNTNQPIIQIHVVSCLSKTSNFMPRSPNLVSKLRGEILTEYAVVLSLF